MALPRNKVHYAPLGQRVSACACSVCVYSMALSGSSGVSISWCNAVAGYGAVGRIVGLNAARVNQFSYA
jgi:hypothetical protein